MRLEGGWASAVAGDGTVLLEKLEEEEEEEEEDDEDTEADGSDDEQEPSQPKFRVLQRAVLRSGFDMKSSRAPGEPLVPGNVMQALETRVNAKGILRVRDATACDDV